MRSSQSPLGTIGDMGLKSAVIVQEVVESVSFEWV